MEEQNGAGANRNGKSSPLTSSARLSALQATGLMQSDPEERFDRFTRMACAALSAPISLISLVDDRSQFFKSCLGLKGWAAENRGTTLAHSFCQHTVITSEPLIITDARLDPRVKTNLAIPDLGVIAYLGMPLVVGEGQVIGSFCVIDTKPREWSKQDISFIHDLCEAVMSEIGLRQAKEAAEAANRAKDRFLAVLSHELRMPISPALMMAQELAGDPEVPARVREDASMIRRNIEQQVRLIDDLLDLTRIENGKLDVRLERLDLNAVLEKTVRHFRTEAALKSVDLSLSGVDCRYAVSGDDGRLVQVFGNILKNALKFTPPRGSVTITISKNKNNSVQVVICDTGIGIQADVLPDLFEAFAQGPEARVREFGGLGLGLAIAKGIIEEHGGTIDAASEGENLGTTFTVTLPLLASATVAVAPPPVAPSIEIRPIHTNILLVEDHEDTLHAMARLLRKFDHRVVTASCVADALKVADDHPIDLLISDVGLPDGSGLELMRRLRDRQTILGIALTGYGSENDHKSTLEAGFSAHLTKPIDFTALLSTIQRVSTVDV